MHFFLMAVHQQQIYQHFRTSSTFVVKSCVSRYTSFQLSNLFNNVSEYLNQILLKQNTNEEEVTQVNNIAQFLEEIDRLLLIYIQ